MKDTLRRHAALQAAAQAKTPPPAAQKAVPAARHWGLPDPGHEYRIPAPAPAPKAKQSSLDTKMVERLAKYR